MLDLAIAAAGIINNITANNNRVIMQTQADIALENIIVAESLGKSVMTSEGLLHILSSIDLFIKFGESIALSVNPVPANPR
jgi:hypothetical protein